MGTKRVVAIEAPERYVAFTWQVNNFCNYSCSYCNPGNYSGEYSNDGNLDIYLANLQELVERYQAAGYEHFKFFFSGGEPTAWRNFVPICEWIRETLPEATIAVNTNLSRPLKWWENHIHLFDDIVASFHVEHSDKQKYLEKNVWLCDKVNYLATKLLMHEERFWEIVEFGKELKAAMPNYFIEWTPLFDELSNGAEPWKYADEDKKKFLEENNVEMEFTIPKPLKENRCVSYVRYDDDTVVPCNSNDLIVHGQNFFKGWDCDVGDCIFINPMGQISLASCGISGTVGHILDDIDNVGPRTMMCDKYHCYCGTDIIIPKRRTEHAEEEIPLVAT